MHVSKTSGYYMEKLLFMYWKVISSKIIAKFPSAALAIQFAKVKSNNEPFEEVLVEECGTSACFRLMKFSGKRNASLLFNDSSDF